MKKRLRFFIGWSTLKTSKAKRANNQPNKIMTNTFSINQIVKGKVAGTFVIIGFRTIGGECYAQVKEVNPNDYTQTAPGEIALPLTKLEKI